ncbi:MAG: Endoglucanase [Anaerocolumna sp.]|jgi:endoglucanase|nr:Endoglucanase [Anaerocolumna sp.]
MKKMKQLVTVISLLLLISTLFYGCSKKSDELQVGNESSQENDVTNSNEDTDNTDPIESEDSNDTTDTDSSESGSENLETTNTDVTETVNNEISAEELAKIEADIKEMRDMTSMDLVKEIKIGWNLGNTFDATGGGNTNNAETSWGNPKTTKEMVDAVKAAGFNTIRIPVTWGNHLGDAPEYKINPDWLNRVQEVVDYAINNGMYTIINLHHEEWHYPSYDNLDTAKTELTAIWSQIADHFKDYDEHLIFEGLNEPRMKGTEFEWNGGNEEGRDVVNQFNAAFVETIRNSAGNNPLRHLMIPNYAASSDPKVWKDFVKPEDEKIIVSVHAYTPYNFALNGGGTSTWKVDNASDTRDIDYLMQAIYDNYVSKGTPVILGEFGARNKDNLADRVAWAEYYIKSAKAKGIPCIWWDNGAFVGNGENFGLLNRKALTWQFPEIVDALMKGLE